MYDPEPTESFCLVDGCWGIYVPKNFAERYDMSAWHVAAEDVEILLAGPDHKFYWDAWSDVLNDAYFEKDGKRFSLEQDSDLFAVRYGEE